MRRFTLFALAAVLAFSTIGFDVSLAENEEPRQFEKAILDLEYTLKANVNPKNYHDDSGHKNLDIFDGGNNTGKISIEQRKFSDAGEDKLVEGFSKDVNSFARDIDLGKAKIYYAKNMTQKPGYHPWGILKNHHYLPNFDFAKYEPNLVFQYSQGENKENPKIYNFDFDIYQVANSTISLNLPSAIKLKEDQLIGNIITRDIKDESKTTLHRFYLPTTNRNNKTIIRSDWGDQKLADPRNDLSYLDNKYLDSLKLEGQDIDNKIKLELADGTLKEFTVEKSGNFVDGWEISLKLDEPSEKFKVYFDTNGGMPRPESQYIDKGQRAEKPSLDPKKEGYIFKYWTKQGESRSFDFNSKINEDIKLLAVYEKNENKNSNSYKFVFKSDKDKNQDLSKAYNVHHAYIKGYPDGTIKADGNVTRAEAVTMLVRLKAYNVAISENEIFSDVEVRDWYGPYISSAYRAGILEEKSGEKFRPNDPMTRAELAQMISYVDYKNNILSPFEDIKGHEFEAAINQAYGNKRIEGYIDGKFKPDGLITRGEIVKILNSLFDRQVKARGLENISITNFKDLDKKHWAYYEIIEASHSHEYIRYEDEKTEEKWMRII